MRHPWTPTTRHSTARSVPALALLALGMPLVLAACSSTSASSAPTAPAPAPTAPASSAPATSAIKTGSVSQGTVIVDKDGMTAYIYTKDTQGSGKSSCTGACLQAWPMITSTSANATGDGVTAKLGTIPTADGGHQVTVDGWPIYTFAKDKAPGDSSGQGVGGVWYMLKPDGSQVGTSSGSGNNDGY